MIKKFIGGYLSNSGIISLAPQQEECSEQKRVNPLIIEYENKLRDFCLNCTKKKCRGYCKNFSDYEHDLLKEYRKRGAFKK